MSLQNRFSFEIMAGTSPNNNGRSPFQSRGAGEQHSAAETEHGTSFNENVKV